MQQFQTEKFHFNLNGFDWDDYSIMKDWPVFHIKYPDGRELVFDLREGNAFEQKKAGGPFCRRIVHDHWYEPASKSEDQLDTDDSYFHYDCNQKGELVFTRGVPTTPENEQVMSSVSIRLEGLKFVLTEYIWVNGTPWLFGVPANPLIVQETEHNKEYFPYSWHFPGEIEVVRASDNFQVKESKILTWELGNIGTIDVYQRPTFDGKTIMRAILTDQKGRKVRFHPTDNPVELTSRKSRFNWRTGEMNFSHRGRTWTRTMNGKAA